MNNNMENIRRFRCWRCGELPYKSHYGKQRGLRCSCRAYVVGKKKWWRQCAIKNEEFPFPEQIPSEAVIKSIIAPRARFG